MLRDLGCRIVRNPGSGRRLHRITNRTLSEWWFDEQVEGYVIPVQEGVTDDEGRVGKGKTVCGRHGNSGPKGRGTGLSFHFTLYHRV